MKNEHGKSILDENDEVQIDMEEFRRLKAKISMAFEEARRERETQITLLSEQFPTFATHSAVKVFPQNEAFSDYFLMRAREYEALLSMKKWFTPAKLEELAQTSPFCKLGYINEW
jgi:hypothetical protein